jgi:hypothetical protein
MVASGSSFHLSKMVLSPLATLDRADILKLRKTGFTDPNDLELPRQAVAPTSQNRD